jgi:hypothetical protein
VLLDEGGFDQRGDHVTADDAIVRGEFGSRDGDVREG